MYRVEATMYPFFSTTLGTTEELHGDIFDHLEELVCFLFGVKVSANNARQKGFDQSFERTQGIIFGFFVSL